MNIGDLLSGPAATRSGHPALIFQGRTYSYGELDRLTNRFASALRAAGIGAGQVIGLVLESGPELVIAALGAFKAGVVPNIVNAMLRPEEVRTVVADSGAVWLLTDSERKKNLESVREGLGVQRIIDVDTEFESLLESGSDDFATVDLTPNTVACLLDTSGTTGNPKGDRRDCPAL